MPEQSLFKCLNKEDRNKWRDPPRLIHGVTPLLTMASDEAILTTIKGGIEEAMFDKHAGDTLVLPVLTTTKPRVPTN